MTVEPPAEGEPWTVLHLVRWSAGYLGDRGVESPRLDVEHLLAHALGCDRMGLYLQFDRPLVAEELAAFRALLLRRASREPLQYILGSAAFRGLELRVDRRALIPRPETEELVEAVLAWTADQPPGAAGSAWDLGTGTGAIALSLLDEGPFERVVASDSSAEAVELARVNAERSGLVDGLDLRVGELFDILRPGERFDVIVANLPYVAEVDRSGLAAEVRDWEPHGALFSGEDGLDAIRRTVSGAPDALRPGGLLALEVGAGQAEAVTGLVEASGRYSNRWVERDLAGCERLVFAVASDSN